MFRAVHYALFVPFPPSRTRSEVNWATPIQQYAQRITTVLVGESANSADALLNLNVRLIQPKSMVAILLFLVGMFGSDWFMMM